MTSPVRGLISTGPKGSCLLKYLYSNECIHLFQLVTLTARPISTRPDQRERFPLSLWCNGDCMEHCPTSACGQGDCPTSLRLSQPGKAPLIRGRLCKPRKGTVRASLVLPWRAPSHSANWAFQWPTRLECSTGKLRYTAQHCFVNFGPSRAIAVGNRAGHRPFRINKCDNSFRIADFSYNHADGTFRACTMTVLLQARIFHNINYLFTSLNANEQIT